MSLLFGGKQEKFREATIKEIGPYLPKLIIGEKQSIVFVDAD